MNQTDSEESVADVLQSSMSGLMNSDMDVYQKVVQLADEGFFERHQTPGSLKALADTLITIPTEGEVSNEGR